MCSLNEEVLGYVSEKQRILAKLICCVIFLPGNGKVSYICAFFMNSFAAIFFLWRETALLIDRDVHQDELVMGKHAL